MVNWDRRYAFFQSPFQAYHWSKAAALFVDIDHTGNQLFPYLLNIVCFKTITDCYIACGRVLLNHQDGVSIGKALQSFKKYFPGYDIKVAHKEKKSYYSLLIQKQMLLAQHLVLKFLIRYVDALFTL